MGLSIAIGRFEQRKKRRIRNNCFGSSLFGRAAWASDINKRSTGFFPRATEGREMALLAPPELGGAGTAAFCLTVGVPQVIVPYCLDHTFWAWRMRTLGVAPPSITRHRLTASALSATIRRAAEDPSFRMTASQLAPQISRDDGLGRAVRILDDHFGRDPSSVRRGSDVLRTSSRE